MKLQDNKITFDSAEEKALYDTMISDSIQKFIKDKGLDIAIVPANLNGGHQADPNAPEDFNAPENESKMQMRKRLKKASVAISGGKLKIMDAPKEIKTIRFFKAMIEGDSASKDFLREVDAEVKALSEGSAADGGNLVPIEFATDLLVAIEDYSMKGFCDNYDMSANELDLRTVTTKPTIYQVGEAVAVTESGTKFGKPQLISKAFAGLQIMSKELFQDNNVGLYEKLVVLFAEGFGARMDNETIVGTTFVGPLSVAAGGSTNITQLAVASAKDVDYQSLVNVTYALSPGQLMKGGMWVMHRTIFGYIQGIVDANKRPIVLNPWDARTRTLLGYPVYLSEQAPQDAATTPIIGFGNWKWVAFGLRQGIQASLLTEATVGGVNLASQRSVGLILDVRFGVNFTLPGNIAVVKTQ
jgi:HK97 family phage major capsid protein